MSSTVCEWEQPCTQPLRRAIQGWQATVLAEKVCKEEPVCVVCKHEKYKHIFVRCFGWSWFHLFLKGSGRFHWHPKVIQRHLGQFSANLISQVMRPSVVSRLELLGGTMGAYIFPFLLRSSLSRACFKCFLFSSQCQSHMFK